MLTPLVSSGLRDVICDSKELSPYPDLAPAGFEFQNSARSSLARFELVISGTTLLLTRLDYCNSLFAGLPDSTLAPLQRVLHAGCSFHQGSATTRPRNSDTHGTTLATSSPTPLHINCVV